MNRTALRRSNNKPMRLAGAMLIQAACWGACAHAGVVTFEQTPNGATPVDNALLSGAYAIDGGGSVSFYFDANGNNRFDAGVDVLPAYELAGDADPQTGFFNSTLDRYDIAGPGHAAQLGQYFLRQPTGLSVLPGPFIVAYATSQVITALSGEIWDIDGNPDPTQPTFGTEQWRIDVLDSAGSVLASQLSPIGTQPTGPFDAAPWTFSFTGLTAGAENIRITYVGTKTSSIGLAFNNFSPTVAVPEPETHALFALGLVALGLAVRHRAAHRSSASSD